MLLNWILQQSFRYQGKYLVKSTAQGKGSKQCTNRSLGAGDGDSPSASPALAQRGKGPAQPLCSPSSEAAKHVGAGRSSLTNILAHVPSVQFNLGWPQSTPFKWLDMCLASPCVSLVLVPAPQVALVSFPNACCTHGSAGLCSLTCVLLLLQGDGRGLSIIQHWVLAGTAGVCCACAILAMLTFLPGKPRMLSCRQSLLITCWVLD